MRDGMVAGTIRYTNCAILALLCSPAAIWGQSEGARLFAKHCAACHGPEGHGTSRGAELAGNRKLRARSISQMTELICTGVPTAGMPPFDLPAAQLDALAAFVHALNSPAADVAVSGDRVAGERFFFGGGQCSSCHMVYGRGKAVGPDLSNIAREMTVDEIRDSLLRPGARISPGYELVTVMLRDGSAVRGFARSRSNFDIQLQEVTGRIRPIEEHEISAIREEKQSFMPPVTSSPVQLHDLLAYLSRLTGVTAGATVVSAETGGMEFSRIVRGEPGDWLSYDGKLTGNRYSELKQINTSTVKRLALKWTSPIPHFGLEVTPLVADGIMYVAGPNQAYALDALTGRRIWVYSRPRTPGLVGDASLGTNRGMAMLGDKVFMVTDNAHLIALNRTSGRLVWDQVMPEEPQHYGSTVAPLVVKDMVIAGVSGADWGFVAFSPPIKLQPVNAPGGTGRFRRKAIRVMTRGRERTRNMGAAERG